ncbi:hypothetical protein [Saccharopolyspora shandongensis]|uniref:hypothetical protein n=1 Tax=Saccharopolyspora shandongensis TaxID=418495 RepID=UPI00115F7E82|nr:hypothetical protein [Saccharopolyspora shandongensis]
MWTAKDAPLPRQLTDTRALGKLATTGSFSRLNLKNERHQLSSVIGFPAATTATTATTGSRRRNFLPLRASRVSTNG